MITLQYDKKVQSYIARCPAAITMDALVAFRQQLHSRVGATTSGGRDGLLFDSNTHQFESIACLKYLRDTFTPQLRQKIVRVAFVAPRAYREPEIVSQGEAYFNDFESAYLWLGET